MILSRTKAVEDPKKNPVTSMEGRRRKEPTVLEDFISARDYTGAITFLEFCREVQREIPKLDLWIAFAAFHLGDYQRALEEYENLARKDPLNDQIYIYMSCCYFMLGKYDEAEQTALKGPKCSLQARVLFHIAYKQKNEEKGKQYEHQLQNTIEDQLSLASMLYMKNQYSEALDIYKRYLVQHRDYRALNVYTALCYYKLDYFDISQELLEVYLKDSSDSATALNLQACNQYRLCNGKAAQTSLQKLFDNLSTSDELYRHNMVVFQNGLGALQVFPSLIDVLPEARLNLIIYHLKQDNFDQAFDLIKDIEPRRTLEFMLKGVVYTIYGQEHQSHEHLQIAQSYFYTIGSSPEECDTIPGRQCMASAYFLQKRFYDVLIYLSSIKSYFYSDDTFNFNYAQSKTREEKWLEAEEAFLLVQNERIKNDPVYLTWLARCYIQNNKARLAWELYLKLERSKESFFLLQLIANDCYKRGCFFYAARAFDALERLSAESEYWEGKLGACAGVVHQIITGHESRDMLRDVLSLLRHTNRPQGDQMIRVIRAWARANNLSVGENFP